MYTQDLGFVHRFIPAQGGVDAPTLLVLHGTGGDETDLLDLGRTLAPEAALLSPRGKVSEYGAARFFRRLAEGMFDIEDLKYRTHELAEFVSRAADAYGFNARNIIAIGYSNGANIAGSLMLLHPGLLKAAVLFRPMVPFVPEQIPDLSGTHVFVSAGDTDRMVSPDQTRSLVQLLEDAGAKVNVSQQPGGHALELGDIRAASEWLRKKQLTEPLPKS